MVKSNFIISFLPTPKVKSKRNYYYNLVGFKTARQCEILSPQICGLHFIVGELLSRAHVTQAFPLRLSLFGSLILFLIFYFFMIFL